MSDPKWLFHGAMKQLAVSWGAMEVMEIWIFTGKWKGTNDESVVKRFFFLGSQPPIRMVHLVPRVNLGTHAKIPR